MIVEEVEAMEEAEEETGLRGLLRTIGLEQYAAALEEQDIELAVLRDFFNKRGRTDVEATLERLGVASAEHRTKIADAVASGTANGEAQQHEHEHAILN